MGENRILDDLKASFAQAMDDSIFSVTENIDHGAMVLIESSGPVYINQQTRDRLKALGPLAYAIAVKRLIPDVAQPLNVDERPINGVKTVKSSARPA
jgi:hypothetical protein